MSPMFVRRAFAGFFISLFVVFTLPTFLLFGLSNSVGKASFYDGPVMDQAYDLLIRITAVNLIRTDPVVEKYFNESQLKAAIMEVFPLELFKGMVKDFSGQLEELKENPEKPLVVSLKNFREGLLTFANNLSYKLFQALPICKGGEIPAEDVQGLPTCVPEGVEYNVVAAPFAKQFETSVYAAVPEQMQIDLNAAMGKSGLTMAAVVNVFLMAKYVLYGILMGLLVIIALLVFSPFSLIAKYEGIAFVGSGIAGYLLSVCLYQLPDYLVNSVGVPDFREEILQMAKSTVSYIVAESQKMALVFLALGAVLILVRVFMTQKYNEEKSD
jgi:hypothetical protein